MGESQSAVVDVVVGRRMLWRCCWCGYSRYRADDELAARRLSLSPKRKRALFLDSRTKRWDKKQKDHIIPYLPLSLSITLLAIGALSILFASLWKIRLAQIERQRGKEKDSKWVGLDWGAPTSSMIQVGQEGHPWLDSIVQNDAKGHSAFVSTLPCYQRGRVFPWSKAWLDSGGVALTGPKGALIGVGTKGRQPWAFEGHGQSGE